MEKLEVGMTVYVKVVGVSNTRHIDNNDWKHIKESMFMYISPKDVHRLTKKVIQKRTTELWSANWDKAQIVCNTQSNQTM